MVSTNYRRIEDLDEARELAERCKEAWFAEDIPQQQWALGSKELEEFRAGRGPRVFTAFRELIDSGPGMEPRKKLSIAELGAGCAHYSDVLQIAGYGQWEYMAVDYSPSFEAWLSKNRPSIKFVRADAAAPTELPFREGQFDVAVEGCMMLHCFEWERVVREVARISNRWVLFHRTALSLSGETEYWAKEAYGHPVLEIHFGMSELQYAWDSAGLRMKTFATIFDGPQYAMSSFLLEKA